MTNIDNSCALFLSASESTSIVVRFERVFFLRCVWSWVDPLYVWRFLNSNRDCTLVYYIRLTYYKFLYSSHSNRARSLYFPATISNAIFIRKYFMSFCVKSHSQPFDKYSSSLVNEPNYSFQIFRHNITFKSKTSRPRHFGFECNVV